MTPTIIKEMKMILNTANKLPTFTGCSTFLGFEVDKASDVI